MKDSTTELGKQIQELQNLLTKMKEDYAREQEQKYRQSKHKIFNIGDWVCKNDEWGKVCWIENEACHLPEEAGYMGFDKYSGFRGFGVTRRDDYSAMSEEDVNYLKTSHQVNLTGEEIQELLYILCVDYNRTSHLTDNIGAKLKLIGKFSFNK